ncbi:hypothetical protein DB35_03465 [Streptomyces abyssalis]|uniref:Integral membrane protein n=1 Tax=Streptomyces abyssalis TaxID=933944 RepID=A0A1E7JPW8_9ACTN|nr:hypothetical protein [Streptomyces abyssalis]OEU90331.1 hypothetical protein AN215_12580 [Streptomyces abyssalis]OEU95068.1 hypothetical protein DB35_03465 [Streptomyces abyssalis]
MTAGADLRLVRAAVFTAVCVTLSAAGHSLTGGQRMPLWSLGLGFAVVFAVAAPLAGRERSLPGIAALLAAGQLALHTLFVCDRPADGGAPARSSAGHGGADAGSAHGADLRSLAARLLCDEQSARTMSHSRARQVVSDAGLDAGRAGGQSGHTGHAAHAGHEAAGSAASSADTPLECLRSAARAALSLFDGPMLLGHVLAALVLGWFLHRGEAALWRLVRLSARSARAAVRHVRASLGAAAACVRALRGDLIPRMPAGNGRRDAEAHGTARSVLLHHSVSRRGPPRCRRQESFALAA